MNIIWSKEALEDLQAVYTYIADDNQKIAIDVVQTLVQFVNTQVGTFPRSGKSGRVVGTYELLVPKLPYIVPYRIVHKHIDILRVYHTRRLWPTQF